MTRLRSVYQESYLYNESASRRGQGQACIMVDQTSLEVDIAHS